MKNTHRAFTLIEVLVSVLILSTSIFYVMKIYSQNHAQALYISKRNIVALEDSLFLTDRTLRYNKEKKNAYDLLHDYFRNLDSKSRHTLKETERMIYVSEPLKLMQRKENGPSAEVEKIIIKDTFSSSYYRFKINRF